MRRPLRGNIGGDKNQAEKELALQLLPWNGQTGNSVLDFEIARLLASNQAFLKNPFKEHQTSLIFLCSPRFVLVRLTQFEYFYRFPIQLQVLDCCIKPSPSFTTMKLPLLTSALLLAGLLVGPGGANSNFAAPAAEIIPHIKRQPITKREPVAKTGSVTAVTSYTTITITSTDPDGSTGTVTSTSTSTSYMDDGEVQQDNTPAIICIIIFVIILAWVRLVVNSIGNWSLLVHRFWM